MGSVAVFRDRRYAWIAAAGAEAASNTSIRHHVAVQHRLIRDWLSNSRGLRVRAEGSALEAWYGRNENLTVGER